METISIALICSLISVIISYLTFQRNGRKETREDVRDNVETKAKLNYIVQAVDEIRLDNKARDREVSDINIRLTKLEESCKSAHKRLDEKENI